MNIQLKELETNSGALSHMAFPPLKIYAEGTERGFALLDRLPSRGLAVVGARNPNPESEQLVRQSIKTITKQNLIIISGFAKGIDACAHLAALEFGLPTIAVLGSGHAKLYPPEHLELKQRILAADGLILSEYPPETAAKPIHFLRRNRLIAGLSQLVWVAQARFRSGAINTAYWARKQEEVGRTVYCLTTPHFPGNKDYAGNQRLMEVDIAQPFWGPASLGVAWLDCATLRFPTLTQQPRSALMS